MPIGFHRSRALWDETKRPQPSVSSWAYALLSAILYELQPIRFSEINWSRLISTARGSVKGLWYALSCLPGLVRVLMKLAWQRKWMVAGVVAYYFAVRWIHDLLEAGPIVLMFTSLIAIFTIGLSDDIGNQDGLSAYSVFNRGFERLMGSVDAEALLAQHIGLPPGAVIPIAPAEAPQRRQPVPRRDQRRIGEEENNDHQNDDNNDAEQPPPPNNNNDAEQPLPPNNNRARKSGKKARRRNLEQRREIQRQRDAAMTMGMQGGDTQEEMRVMQRLIEEQIENENNN
jgi:hypothetical protein